MKRYWFEVLLLVSTIGIFYDAAGQAGVIQATIPQVVPAANKRGSATVFQLAGDTGTAAAGTLFCDDGSGNATTAGCTGGAAGATGATGASGGGAGTTWWAGSVTPIVSANWSSFGTGCATSLATGVTGGTALQVISSSGAQNTCGYQTAVSAGDFSHVFIVYGSVSAPQFENVLVGFTDGTSTEGCGLGSGSDSTIDALASQHPKATALSGGTVSAANGVSSYVIPFPNGSGPMFLRLKRTGTHLICDYSPDGQNFINFFTDTTPFLTASALYFAADPRGASALAAGWLESYN